MSILTIILVCVVVGVILLVVNRFVPMEATIKRILNIVVIIALILWLLHAFGVWGYLERVSV